MAEAEYNPWKLTTIALLLVFATALVTALVMADWGTSEKPQASRVASGSRVRRAAVPMAADIEACNAQAKAQVSSPTTEVLKDAAIGGVVGATAGTLYGINEANKNDVRYQETYRQCMRGRGYMG